MSRFVVATLAAAVLATAATGTAAATTTTTTTTTAAATAAAAAPPPVAAASAGGEPSPPAASARPGSAIFLHPDGMGANTWMAVRLVAAGPDGRIAWDRLPAAAVYVGPMLDSVTATSNGGATTHAWGVRAATSSYGMIGGQRIERAASGYAGPLMAEAQRAGKKVGLVNTSTVAEPGTGAFLAAVPNRRDQAEIVSQIMAARPDVLLGGGESLFLPTGVRGAHGTGVRTDGRDLIAEAHAAGYTVVRTRAELLAVPAGTTRLLGLFAADATFAEGTEEALARTRTPVFGADVPRFDEMIAAALAILQSAPEGFLLVGNEEATDDLAGDNNARAVIDAGLGADRAIEHALELAARDPSVTVVVASDSDCGGLVVGGDDVVPGRALPPRAPGGGALDGDAANGNRPFLAAPDRAGKRWPFVVHWASDGDLSGGVVTRAIGPGAALVQGTIDAMDVYRALHRGLFGESR